MGSQVLLSWGVAVYVSWKRRHYPLQTTDCDLTLDLNKTVVDGCFSSSLRLSFCKLRFVTVSSVQLGYRGMQWFAYLDCLCYGASDCTFSHILTSIADLEEDYLHLCLSLLVGGICDLGSIQLSSVWRCLIHHVNMLHCTQISARGNIWFLLTQIILVSFNCCHCTCCNILNNFNMYILYKVLIGCSVHNAE